MKKKCGSVVMKKRKGKCKEMTEEEVESEKV